VDRLTLQGQDRSLPIKQDSIKYPTWDELEPAQVKHVMVPHSIGLVAAVLTNNRLVW
jgi:hypothetical protein